MVQGGIYGEDDEWLGDAAAFDFSQASWVRFKQTKKNREIAGELGRRCYHSMTAVTDPGIDKLKRNSKQLWAQEPSKHLAAETRGRKKALWFNHSGIFVFGGINEEKKLSNDLWMMTPDYQRNQKYLTPSGNYKKTLTRRTLAFSLTKLQPEGRSPCPRYGHAACFIQHYLCIHGGRNDGMFSSLKNIGLNDLHLFDVNLNTWLTVCVYGQLPSSRWGHTICAEDTMHEDYQG